jgi:PqqD family protein of HPr-rel-A system
MKWQVDTMGLFYDADEGTTVYFDPASGDTHLISDFSAYLIQQFAEQPLGMEALIARISPDLAPEDLAEMTQATPDLLAELVALDILQRV